MVTSLLAIHRLLVHLLAIVSQMVAKEGISNSYTSQILVSNQLLVDKQKTLIDEGVVVDMEEDTSPVQVAMVVVVVTEVVMIVMVKVVVDMEGMYFYFVIILSVYHNGIMIITSKLLCLFF